MDAFDNDPIERAMQQARAERARAIARGIGTLPALIAGGGRKLRHWLQRRAAYRALQALDDRTLKDVGLYRNDLWRIADGEERDVPAIASSGRDEEDGAADAANDNPLLPQRSTGIHRRSA